MAAIDPQPVIDAAQPWCCVPQGDLWLAVLAALIDVGNGDPVPTDVNELMEQVACLKCAVQPGDVPLLILGAVSNITGGGGGGSATLCGSGPPVAAPTGTCALYIDTDDGTLYEYYSGAWH